MLSRTASDLYWMSRYLERAENLARMLDISYSLSLMPQDGRGDGLHELAMPLLITGTLDDYLERHGELHAERLLHFSPWMRPTRRASTAVSAARASAHAVRGESPRTCGRTSTPPGWKFAALPSRASAATA
jgi:uncharacterized alpha-E superfamily protein